MIGNARPATLAGATRTCPHCRATILESAIVCPGCKHHLRFDKDARPGGAAATKTAWRVEGTLDAEHMDSTTEYSILVVVRNERNEEVARQVVNVGSLQGVERRTFTLSIETSEPKPAPLQTLRRR
jgi:Zn finger protein HypA/HybF involved in hydrogenase expression